MTKDELLAAMEGMPGDAEICLIHGEFGQMYFASSATPTQVIDGPPNRGGVKLPLQIIEGMVTSEPRRTVLLIE